MATADPGTYEPTLDVLEAFLTQIGRQIPFATAQALNDVAGEFQNYQRTYQELTFTIRERQFFRFAIKRRKQDNASPKNLESTVWIDDRVRRVKGYSASRRPDIWQRLQFDRTRKPKKGNRYVAVPTDNVERTGRGLIKKSAYPTDTSGKPRSKRTFVVSFGSGDAGIFKRIGRRQKAFTGVERGSSFGKGSRVPLGNDPNVRLMYVLKKQTPLKPEFDYYENAQFVFRRRWPNAWQTRLVAAFRTIKFRKGGFR